LGDLIGNEVWGKYWGKEEIKKEKPEFAGHEENGEGRNIERELNEGRIDDEKGRGEPIAREHACDEGWEKDPRKKRNRGKARKDWGRRQKKGVGIESGSHDANE
jgi:hypothetical protein